MPQGRAQIKVKSKKSKVKRIQAVGFWSLVFSKYRIQRLKKEKLQNTVYKKAIRTIDSYSFLNAVFS